MKALQRIVSALMAAAIFPIAATLELVLVQISTTVVDVGVEESFSIWRIIKIFMGDDDTFSPLLSGKKFNIYAFQFPKALEPVKTRLIAFVVLFLLALAAALFILIFAACSGKKLPVIIGSVIGIGLTIAMTVVFNSASQVITSGSINVLELFFDSGLLSSLLGGFVQVDTFALGGYRMGMIIAFIAIIVWNVSFMLVEIGDEEEEKAKLKKAKH